MADAQDQSLAADTARRPVTLITKACDLCRKKKIRCQPTPDGCAQCTRAKVASCHFTPIATKKKPRLPPGHKRIAMLEEGLRRMEGLLQDALGKPEAGPGRHGGDPSFTDDDANPFRSTSGSGSGSVNASASASGVHPPLPVMEERLALLSPPPVTRSLKGALELGPFSLPSFHALPPQHVALKLVEEAFTGYNDFYPLFDKTDFFAQFYSNYARSSTGDPGWWACINAVLSLAHRLRAMCAVGDLAEENNGSCGHIHNALATVSELMLQHESLAAVQALVSIVALLQCTPNPHAASVFITAALRLAQGMGLHRRTCHDARLSPAQHEQGRRVFWLAYCFDKDISLRTGQPFLQDDDDMDPDLPSAVRPPTVALPCGSQEIDDRMNRINMNDNNSKNVAAVDIFHARIGIAVIQGQIYKKLYSVQATRQSAAHRAAVAQELNTLLLYWKGSVSVNDAAMEVAGTAGAPGAPVVPFTTEFFHRLILHFTYVNCLAMVDAHLPPPPQQQQGQFEGDVVVSESICVVESRRAMALVQGTPRGDYAFVWVLLRPLFSAVTVLLDNAIRSPSGPSAMSDLAAVEHAIQLLAMLAGDKKPCSQSQEAQHMYPICRDLRSRAEEAVHRASSHRGVEMSV